MFKLNKMLRKALLSTIVMVVGVSCIFAQQGIKVKDAATIGGLEDVQLYGYGLVVGLAGTGDRSQTVFTTQTVVNMLKNMGIEVPEQQLRTRNVASVMVTGNLPPFKRRGTKIDVTISSMGDATSLEGGTLILTGMQGHDGTIYASAQGPLATGGYDVNDKGLLRVRKNHVMVGRIPDGANIQQEYAMTVFSGNDLSLSLSTPDFTTAVSMAKAINDDFNRQFNSPIAVPQDAATISLNFNIIARDSIKNYIGLIQFISRVQNITFDAASQAKVVMNERTGTIVAGGDIRISPIAVTQGGIKIEVINTPEVVQPQPFGNGTTQIITRAEARIDEKEVDMVVLNATNTVSELAQALNSLGVSPRDVIAIFQAIKEAGALHGQLVIM